MSQMGMHMKSPSNSQHKSAFFTNMSLLPLPIAISFVALALNYSRSSRSHMLQLILLSTFTLLTILVSVHADELAIDQNRNIFQPVDDWWQDGNQMVTNKKEAQAILPFTGIGISVHAFPKDLGNGTKGQSATFSITSSGKEVTSGSWSPDPESLVFGKGYKLYDSHDVLPLDEYKILVTNTGVSLAIKSFNISQESIITNSSATPSGTAVMGIAVTTPQSILPTTTTETRTTLISTFISVVAGPTIIPNLTIADSGGVKAPTTNQTSTIMRTTPGLLPSDNIAAEKATLDQLPTKTVVFIVVGISIAFFLVLVALCVAWRRQTTRSSKIANPLTTPLCDAITGIEPSETPTSGPSMTEKTDRRPADLRLLWDNLRINRIPGPLTTPIPSPLEFDSRPSTQPTPATPPAPPSPGVRLSDSGSESSLLGTQLVINESGEVARASRTWTTALSASETLPSYTHSGPPAYTFGNKNRV
ncbi:hypothetical protein BXZ70DRAFT_520279 [Cristinia sonorae]|uniref:Uncharacterized protein n=1 Tax=Cristinia sonorae TaxID=1940300 RepID=A0A8K0UV08_9AGAR|nr:hypothetical protein BXZ70DRAFT_520279 [Cristinia sonorae]